MSDTEYATLQYVPVLPAAAVLDYQAIFTSSFLTHTFRKDTRLLSLHL